jgi:uncharacterized protein
VSGVTRWRVGIGWYVFAVAAMPAFTIVVSLATGTLPHGIVHMGLSYLVSLLVGVVFTNLWEEVAWAGLVQSRLTAQRGLLLGAVITGPLFAAQHLPIVVASGGGPVGMLVVGTVLTVACMFFRYVIGAALVGTGGSLLVVGLLHASSDAAGAAFGSGWQQMLASVPLALLLLVYRAVRRRSTLEPVAVPA